MNVTLVVPDHLQFQYVYRTQPESAAAPALPPGMRFELLRGATDGGQAGRRLVAGFGPVGAAKALAKLASPRRQLYLLSEGRRVLSYGWGMVGRCRYYKIEPDALVVGPIWTAPEARGRGLATTALQAALAAWWTDGRRIFYIDTERNHVAAQKVFAKCGFGPPMALYIR